LCQHLEVRPNGIAFTYIMIYSDFLEEIVNGPCECKDNFVIDGTIRFKELYVALIKDNICNDVNNNAECDWDGGDCCRKTSLKALPFCINCTCLGPFQALIDWRPPQLTTQFNLFDQKGNTFAPMTYKYHPWDQYGDKETKMEDYHSWD
jgi:hypothetical protein